MIDKLGTKWLEIDLDALQRNVRRIQRRVHPARVLAVVKADGYGHGAEEVARAAAQCGVAWFGVSCLEEAVALRQAFFNRSILIMGALPVSQAVDVLNYHLTPTLCDEGFGRALSKEAVRLKKTVGVHICVDTGMGRVGPFYTEAIPFILRMAKLQNIVLDGLYSHFATADKARNGFAKEQLKRFKSVVQGVQNAGVKIPHLHLANSGGILNYPGSFFDLVRPGLLLYGISPSKKRKGYPALDNVLSFKTRVAYKYSVAKGFSVGYGKSYVTTRATDILTLPVGYADGFSRAFSNRGEVLVRGRRLPVVGSVCMDMLMVDAGKNSGIEVGEEAVLIGRQGREAITVYDMAQGLQTIPYEVISNLGRRATRVYLKNGHPHTLRRMVSEF